MRKTFIFLFIILILGCQSKISSKIINRIKILCGNKENCIIKISDVTDFEWDKMYIFNTSASLEEINKVLGLNYPYYSDVAKRIIFIKANMVVYHEDDFPYSNEKSKGKVFFSFKNDTIDYMFLKINEAVFKVKIEGSGENVFYELSLLR